MPGGNKAIRVDKPPSSRIVIPCLEVIETRLGVEIITSVTEGVLNRNGDIASYCEGCTVAPRIILVHNLFNTVLVINRYDIALQILFKPVGIKRTFRIRGVAVRHADRAAVRVVEVNEEIRAPGLADDLRAVQEIASRCAARGLRRADAVGIVRVRRRGAALGGTLKLPPVFPREAIARAVVIRQRVSDFIVRQLYTVIPRELVAPPEPRLEFRWELVVLNFEERTYQKKLLGPLSSIMK